jgi:UDP-glucose 4-epimerase
LTILLPGGAGFIGSHVADAYIEAGHAVIIVDDLSTGSLKNVNPKARFCKLDIRGKELQKIFEQQKIDVVNHHAAQMDVRRSVDDPAYDASVNILGGLNLLENCKRFGVKKFIFASTGGAIYGEQDYFPADENHPVRPLSPYGITKLATEKYLYYYKEVFSIQYVSLRYANVYGPRQNPQGEAGVVAIFTSRMLAGQQPVINGDGKQTRDYTYVKDVVNANLAALTYNESDIFNIGTGIETDVNKLFTTLRTLTRSNSTEHHGPHKPGEQKRSVIDATKAKKILGWKPHYSLQEGLQETVEYFKTSR